MTKGRDPGVPMNQTVSYAVGAADAVMEHWDKNLAPLHDRECKDCDFLGYGYMHGLGHLGRCLLGHYDKRTKLLCQTPTAYSLRQILAGHCRPANTTAARCKTFRPAQDRWPGTPRGTAPKAQQQCDEWNSKYGVGIDVYLAEEGGREIITTTQGKAHVLGEVAIIPLFGCYEQLDHIRPRFEKE